MLLIKFVVSNIFAITLSVLSTAWVIHWFETSGRDFLFTLPVLITMILIFGPIQSLLYWTIKQPFQKLVGRFSTLMNQYRERTVEMKRATETVNLNLKEATEKMRAIGKILDDIELSRLGIDDIAEKIINKPIPEPEAAKPPSPSMEPSIEIEGLGDQNPQSDTVAAKEDLAFHDFVTEGDKKALAEEEAKKKEAMGPASGATSGGVTGVAKLTLDPNKEIELELPQPEKQEIQESLEISERPEGDAPGLPGLEDAVDAMNNASHKMPGGSDDGENEQNDVSLTGGENSPQLVEQDVKEEFPMSADEAEEDLEEEIEEELKGRTEDAEGETKTINIELGNSSDKSDGEKLTIENTVTVKVNKPKEEEKKTAKPKASEPKKVTRAAAKEMDDDLKNFSEEQKHQSEKLKEVMDEVRTLIRQNEQASQQFDFCLEEMLDQEKPFKSEIMNLKHEIDFMAIFKRKKNYSFYVPPEDGKIIDVTEKIKEKNQKRIKDNGDGNGDEQGAA